MSQLVEKTALRKAMWFGILQLVGLIAGWVVTFYVFGTASPTRPSMAWAQTRPHRRSARLGHLFQGLLLLIPTVVGRILEASKGAEIYAVDPDQRIVASIW